MNKRNGLGILLVAGLLIAACTPLVTPTPGPVTTVPEPASGSQSSQPVDEQESGVGDGQLAALPSPGLFDVSWQDRTAFRGNLLEGQQAVLETLPGASVYHIDLSIDDTLTRVEGKQEVLYTNREDDPLDRLVFRLFANLSGGLATVSNLAVNGQPLAFNLEGEESVLTVPLPEPLQTGDQVVVQMDFAVEIPVDGSSNYGTFAYLDDVLALAHFYPMVAVYDDRGWNEEIPSQAGDIVYNDASLYLVRADVPADLLVAASGSMIDREQVGGRQVLTIAAGPARDFYLAASPRYQVVSDTVDGITVNSYAFPEHQEGAETIMGFAIEALDSFSDRFGPYPYSELDFVGTPTSALGVEYPGIIAMANRTYTSDNVIGLEATTAHEVGHQWLYNVIGNDQVGEPWLDEAMVQYATMRYFEDRYGRAGYDGFRQSLTDRWGRVGNEEIPIGQPVDAYPGAAYGAIVYGRGPLFFEALENEMGRERFDSFLRDYYEEFRWQNVAAGDLRSLAEAHCDCDLTALFEAWVYGQ
ncbi:MAG: M1 family metallopeptidase [Chloroflexota bacterium]|nr:M1 family metallopeptidase [Chloroflexota bacterium]